MFEWYEKEYKKYDFEIKIDFILKTTIIIAFFLNVLIDYFILSNLFMQILFFLLTLNIIAIVVFQYINYYIKKEVKYLLKKSYQEKLSYLFDILDEKKKNYFLLFLKENNINSKEKIKYLIDLYKDKVSPSLNIDSNQNIFIIITTLVSLTTLFYNEDSKILDLNKLISCLFVVGYVLIFYFVYLFYKYIIFEVYFSNRKNINQKLINLLTYYYLNFEKYENDLLCNTKI